jgi:hypothetical protein
MRQKTVHRYRRAHRVAHRVRVSRRVHYTRRHTDNTFNDEVSSIQARQPACRVTLYKHCNYRGRSVSLTPGRYNMHALMRKGMKNDDISSVRVSKGCVAHLYQHWNFGGARLTKHGNDSCFTNDVMFRRTICRNQCRNQCRSHRVCYRKRVSYRGLSHYNRAMHNTRRHMNAAARRMHAARRAAAAHARKYGKGKKCTGKSWCETFYTCKKGDKRNFHAFVKNQGYRMHKGACAHSNGRYGRRHKFWRGKFTFAQCKAKCDRMGRKCEGITMTSGVKCSRREAADMVQEDVSAQVTSMTAEAKKMREMARNARLGKTVEFIQRRRRARRGVRRGGCYRRVCRVYRVCSGRRNNKAAERRRKAHLRRIRAHRARLHRARRIRERKGKNARRIAAAKKRERAAKKKAAELKTKEKNAKRKERADKAKKRRIKAERDSKRARERRGKEQKAKRVARERSAKVRAAQARERRAKVVRRNNERRAKHHHRIRKERTAKHHHRLRVNRERAAKHKARSRKSCSGHSWCETFYSCKRGDGRNFHAFVKNQGYRMHKGACAHSNGRYGRRHRFWGGRFSFATCKAKCDRMGHRCQGITMTTAVKCNGRRAAPRRGGARYSGRGWCETFYVCKRGDGRNFWAWTKRGGYRMHKGACAHSNGRYGRRHKFWGGRFTFGQCEAKCDRMGHRCQGITMPKNIRRVRM